MSKDQDVRDERPGTNKPAIKRKWGLEETFAWSGKTTLALQAVARASVAGGIAAYVDAEPALDASYAAKLGVQVKP